MELCNMKSTATNLTESKIQNPKSKILLIGYGNPLRGDDGAGQRVATAIAKWNLSNLQSIAVHQLLPELAEPLAATEQAIFVDVYPADVDQGLQIRRLETNPDIKLSAGHTADPRSLLALTQQVYGTSPASWWVLIPAICFEFGEQLSTVTEQGINDALQQIQELIKECQEQSIDTAEEIRIQGTVQGVGFRPMVYRLATTYQLRGEVLNDGQGVLIRVAGSAITLDKFVEKIQQEIPPLAHITAIQRQPIDVNMIPFEAFTIAPSANTFSNTDIAADAATCPQCRAEIFDPASRWYRYPFTNCTHCGPRLSIIQGIPYDRHQTSMAKFPLCASCQQDYDDVNQRRFHAQPIACPDCGPQVWLEQVGQSHPESVVDAIAAATKLLLQGKIIAIKGLGGFHLVCDATHEIAVKTLRDRKHREDKPFALMARDLTVIEQYCTLSPEAIQQLESPAAPIVLLPISNPETLCPRTPMLAPIVAPGLNTLGVMLPYTPLHHLLFEKLDRPLVFTSGNRSDEPPCIDNDKAREQLGTIADYFLLHNREIINRVDDSIVRMVGNQPQLSRRARGYAPAPISLPPGFAAAPDILAMGSELKNTFCLIRSGQAILSQHLGDLEQAETSISIPIISPQNLDKN
jgi:hydrogenase maturation protein HypF